jgi:hypothetical protein
MATRDRIAGIPNSGSGCGQITTRDASGYRGIRCGCTAVPQIALQYEDRVINIYMATTVPICLGIDPGEYTPANIWNNRTRKTTPLPDPD